MRKKKAAVSHQPSAVSPAQTADSRQPMARSQPRLHWRSRPIVDRPDHAQVLRLYLGDDPVGEVTPHIPGNPLRGRIEGYVWHSFACDAYGIDYQHTGDRGGLATDLTTARTQLIAYVQECLKARGLRP